MIYALLVAVHTFCWIVGLGGLLVGILVGSVAMALAASRAMRELQARVEAQLRRRTL